MSPEKLTHFRDLLVAKRQALLSGGDEKADPIHQEGERPDEDAQPLAEMSQAIASSRNQSRSETLEAITTALTTIRDYPEDYGLCEECEEPIPLKRLELMPWAPLCVTCQSKQEFGGRGATRRNLTDYIS